MLTFAADLQKNNKKKKTGAVNQAVTAIKSVH